MRVLHLNRSRPLLQRERNFSEQPPPTAYGAGREKGGREEKEEEEEDERFQDPDNEVGLFAYGQFDQEDDEADRIYKEVDEKMDKRRKARRLVHAFHSCILEMRCSSGLPPVVLDRRPT